MGKKYIVVKDQPLVRSAVNADWLTIKPSEAKVSVMIDLPDALPAGKADRVVEAARDKVMSYVDIITEEVGKLETKVKALLEAAIADPSKADSLTAEAKGMIKATSVSVANAGKSVQGAAQIAALKVFNAEVEEDAEYRNYKVKIAVNFVWSGVKIGVAVARITVTGGADVTAWKTLIKTVIKIGMTIAEMCKGEEELRDALVKQIQKLAALVDKTVADNARAATGSPADKAKALLGALKNAMKSPASKADVSRKKFKMKLVGIRQEVDKLATKAVAALNAGKSAETNATKKAKVETAVNAMLTKATDLAAVLRQGTVLAENAKKTIADATTKLDNNYATVASGIQGLGKLLPYVNKIKSAITTIKEAVEAAA